MSTTEQWREIAGHPDYRVSDLGRVASVKRGRFRILTGGKSQMGYRNVLFYTGGQRSGHRVHALVAAAFHGPRPDGLQIRHLDGDQLNNAATNLAYGTYEENLEDMRRHRGRLLIVDIDPVPSWATKAERRRASRKRPACCTPLHVSSVLRHTCEALFWQQVAPVARPLAVVR